MHREQKTSDAEQIVTNADKTRINTNQEILTKEQAVFISMFILGDSVTINELIEYTQLERADIEGALEKVKPILKDLGLDIVKSQEGLQLMTINIGEEILHRIKKKELDGDLSAAALQVMTIIAYMPGCSRSDVSYIRGAQSSSSIRNLISRGLVMRKDESCYITNEALSHLGVTSNDELPEYGRLHQEFTNKLTESLKYE